VAGGSSVSELSAGPQADKRMAVRRIAIMNLNIFLPDIFFLLVR
jgi:hypothetical protein